MINLNRGLAVKSLPQEFASIEQLYIEMGACRFALTQVDEREMLIVAPRPDRRYRAHVYGLQWAEL